MKVTGYNPAYDFQIDLAFGQIGETQLIQFFQAVQNGKVEVKSDRYRNGRMAIETQQKPLGGSWKDSGINTTEAEWWAYRLAPESFVFVSVARLKRYLRTHKNRLEKRDFACDSINPSRGFLLYPEDVQDMQTNKAYDTPIS